MNLKKMVYVNTILTFILAFLTHSIYNLLPNPIFSIFFSVNESIWEHMKMLYTTVLLYGIIEHFILKKYDLDVNNELITTVIKSIIIIPIYLILFLPIYYLIGDSFIIAIIIMLISIFIVNLIGSKLLDIYEIDHQKTISIFIIIIVYVIMTILTYYPPHINLFYDKEAKIYGIKN